MLNKENYVPWSSRLLRYAKSRPNEKLIYNSILNGPYVRQMIAEPGDAERDVNEIWLRVQQMMKGSDIGIQEKKAKSKGSFFWHSGAEEKKVSWVIWGKVGAPLKSGGLGMGSLLVRVIGAEVHGKVDGAFDSGYLMTATVNGRIFRGVLFPPGPEVVSRGTFRGHNRRSPTSHVAQRNLHINRAFIRHSNHTPPHVPEPSHHGYAQDHVHRPSPVVRSVPAPSLGREQQRVPSELHGVVLTLGGPGSGHG
nr:galactose oxidase/kelch, beta-propeller [Tanacetum cinerariifolium]